MERKNSSFITGVLFIVFGIMFILSPKSVFESIVYFAGLVVVVHGLLKIYFSVKSTNPYASLYTTGAILSVMFGFILIANRDIAVNVIPVILGGFLLVTSLPTFIFLVKSNSNRKLIIKSLLKVLVGFCALALPILPVTIFGIVLGVVLILSGVTTIMNFKQEEEVIYKVRVKK